jgi:hypothetical protein
MSADDMAAFAVALLTIIGSFFAAVRWLFKHYISEHKDDHKGGHNLEGRVRRIENKLDTLYEILITKN